MVTPPTSLGAVMGDVARLPRVALGMISGRILRVVTGIIYLWTLVMLGDIPSRYKVKQHLL